MCVWEKGKGEGRRGDEGETRKEKGEESRSKEGLEGGEKAY
jgi:hypothetical protein